jgi:hypothetical protein
MSHELLAAAERDHRMEIVNAQPRRWLVDRDAITTLAIGQGVTPQQLSELIVPGYELVEGKVCRLNGHAYLHLVLSRGGDRVSLFVQKTPAGAQFARSARSDDAAGFADGRFSALAVAGDSKTAEALAHSMSIVL